MITTAPIVRVPAASGYGKYILTFVRGPVSLKYNFVGSGSVWVHQNETVHSGSGSVRHPAFKLTTLILTFQPITWLKVFLKQT